MILNLLIFLSGAMSLIIVAPLITNYKNGNDHNKYLILLLVSTFSHRVYYVLFILNIIDFEIKYNLNLAYLIAPLYFFMILELHKKDVSKRLNAVIFSFTSLVLIMKSINYISADLNFAIFFTYSSLLMILSVRIGYKSFVRSNYNYSSVKFKLSSLFLLHAFIIYCGINYLMLNYLNKVALIYDLFYKTSSLSWIIIMCFMIFNPELLFGKSKLQLLALNEYLDGFSVWSLKPLKKTNSIDYKLSKRISSVSANIIKINRVLEKDPDLIHKFSMKKLNEKIRIPESHFNYLFKFHCHLSKHEFRNYHQVNFVINKIKEGYLKKHTMDALIDLSGFKSKMTFYRSFKKITKSTPLAFAQKYSESL